MKAKYSASPRTISDGDSTNPLCDSKGILLTKDSGTTYGTVAAAADATVNPTLGGLITFLMGFNGTSWDRVRTAVVAKTATFTGLLNAIVMGRYNSSPPALTSGDVQLLQLDSTGNLRTVEQQAPVAEDNTVGVIKVEQRFSYTNMTTATTTLIKSGAGFLHAIVLNTQVASATVELDDALTHTAPIIGKVTCSSALSVDPIAVIYDVSFTTGLSITTSGATDITVVWR